VFIAVDRDTGIPATAAAVAETTAPADGQLPAATAESHHLSAITDDVTSLLPTTLLTSSSSCDKSGFSSEGAAAAVQPRRRLGPRQEHRDGALRVRQRHRVTRRPVRPVELHPAARHHRRHHHDDLR